MVPPVCYIKGQKEQGGTTGLIHWQILAQTSKKVTLAQLKRCFVPQAHVELSRSSAADAYVWKEDTRIEGSQFEMGEKPLNRSSKEDWEKIFESAKQGKLHEIPADVKIRHYSALKRIRVDFMENIPRDNVQVRFLTGPTGTGKTRLAWDEAGTSAYIKNPNTKWWDGYRGQQNVIIDEFTGRIDISYLLTWFDNYPCMVEVKGFTVPLAATNFWVTSNLSLEDCYKEANEEQLKALKRRLRVVHVRGDLIMRPL